MALVAGACFIVGLLVGRRWALLAPAAGIALGILLTGVSSLLAGAVSEDIQAAVVIGSAFGLLTAALGINCRAVLRSRERG